MPMGAMPSDFIGQQLSCDRLYGDRANLACATDAENAGCLAQGRDRLGFCRIILPGIKYIRPCGSSEYG